MVVDGAGRARHFVRVGSVVWVHREWYAHVRGWRARTCGVACARVWGGVRACAGWRAGWRGCTENGRRACGVACARRSGQRASRDGGVGSGGGEVWGSRWTTPLVASAAGRTARTNLPRIQDTSARAPRSRCHSLAPELQAQAASALAWQSLPAAAPKIGRFSKLDYSRILNGLVDTLQLLPLRSPLYLTRPIPPLRKFFLG